MSRAGRIPGTTWSHALCGRTVEVERGGHGGRQGLSGTGTDLAGSLKASWPLAGSSLEMESSVLLAAPRKCGLLEPRRQLLRVVGQHQLY